MHPVCGVEASEGHLHAGADDDCACVHVRHLASVPTAAVEIHDSADDRGREAVGQVVDGHRGHAAADVGQSDVVHLIDRSAPEAHAHGR